MGCLYVLITLISPRVLIVGLWLMTEYVRTAFGSIFWPILGLIFMPYLTLALIWGYNSGFGFWQIGACVLGACLDLGSNSGAEQQRRKRVERA